MTIFMDIIPTVVFTRIVWSWRRPHWRLSLGRTGSWSAWTFLLWFSFNTLCISTDLPPRRRGWQSWSSTRGRFLFHRVQPSTVPWDLVKGRSSVSYLCTRWTQTLLRAPWWQRVCPSVSLFLKCVHCAKTDNS
jgi:hypothetical protein